MSASGTLDQEPAIPAQRQQQEKVLPLPTWLKNVYYVFPIILYIPDVIFNYYVYSDGWKPDPNPVLNIMKSALVFFLSVGIVGMAYLLSVLAPWHWGQGHRMQAIASGIGVVIATAITTWNSLSYRSADFATFKTDDWAWGIFPDLKTMGISITMVLVAIAPPFWGLFWAIVQPTQTGRTLAQLNESHQERLLRLQQEAELKRLRAETNAKVREAQLRGVAATAAAAREQASGLIGRGGGKKTDTPANEGIKSADAVSTPSPSSKDERSEAAEEVEQVVPAEPAEPTERDESTWYPGEEDEEAAIRLGHARNRTVRAAPVHPMAIYAAPDGPDVQASQPPTRTRRKSPTPTPASAPASQPLSAAQRGVNAFN